MSTSAVMSPQIVDEAVPDGTMGTPRTRYMTRRQVKSPPTTNSSASTSTSTRSRNRQDGAKGQQPSRSSARKKRKTSHTSPSADAKEETNMDAEGESELDASLSRSDDSGFDDQSLSLSETPERQESEESEEFIPNKARRRSSASKRTRAMSEEKPEVVESSAVHPEVEGLDDKVEAKTSAAVDFDNESELTAEVDEAIDEPMEVDPEPVAENTENADMQAQPDESEQVEEKLDAAEGDGDQTPNDVPAAEGPRRAPRKKRKWLKKGEVDPDDPVAVERQRHRHAMLDHADAELQKQVDAVEDHTHAELLKIEAELEKRYLKQKAACDMRYYAVVGELERMRDHAKSQATINWKVHRERLVVDLTHEVRHKKSQLEHDENLLDRNPNTYPNMREGRGSGGWPLTNSKLLSKHQEELIPAEIGSSKVRRAWTVDVSGIGSDAAVADLARMGFKPSREQSPGSSSAVRADQQAKNKLHHHHHHHHHHTHKPTSVNTTTEPHLNLPQHHSLNTSYPPKQQSTPVTSGTPGVQSQNPRTHQDSRVGSVNEPPKASTSQTDNRTAVQMRYGSSPYSLFASRPTPAPPPQRPAPAASEAEKKRDTPQQRYPGGLFDGYNSTSLLGNNRNTSAASTSTKPAEEKPKKLNDIENFDRYRSSLFGPSYDLGPLYPFATRRQPANPPGKTAAQLEEEAKKAKKPEEPPKENKTVQPWDRPWSAYQPPSSASKPPQATENKNPAPTKSREEQEAADRLRRSLFDPLFGHRPRPVPREASGSSSKPDTPSGTGASAEKPKDASQDKSGAASASSSPANANKPGSTYTPASMRPHIFNANSRYSPYSPYGSFASRQSTPLQKTAGAASTPASASKSPSVVGETLNGEKKADPAKPSESPSQAAKTPQTSAAKPPGVPGTTNQMPPRRADPFSIFDRPFGLYPNRHPWGSGYPYSSGLQRAPSTTTPGAAKPGGPPVSSTTPTTSQTNQLDRKPSDTTPKSAVGSTINGQTKPGETPKPGDPAAKPGEGAPANQYWSLREGSTRDWVTNMRNMQSDQSGEKKPGVGPDGKPAEPEKPLTPQEEEERRKAEEKRKEAERRKAEGIRKGQETRKRKRAEAAEQKRKEAEEQAKAGGSGTPTSNPADQANKPSNSSTPTTTTLSGGGQAGRTLAAPSPYALAARSPTFRTTPQSQLNSNNHSLSASTLNGRDTSNPNGSAPKHNPDDAAARRISDLLRGGPASSNSPNGPGSANRPGGVNGSSAGSGPNGAGDRPRPTQAEIDRANAARARASLWRPGFGSIGFF